MLTLNKKRLTFLILLLFFLLLAVFGYFITQYFNNSRIDPNQPKAATYPNVSVKKPDGTYFNNGCLVFTCPYGDTFNTGHSVDCDWYDIGAVAEEFPVPGNINFKQSGDANSVPAFTNINSNNLVSGGYIQKYCSGAQARSVAVVATNQCYQVDLLGNGTPDPAGNNIAMAVGKVPGNTSGLACAGKCPPIGLEFSADGVTWSANTISKSSTNFYMRPTLAGQPYYGRGIAIDINNAPYEPLAYPDSYPSGRCVYVASSKHYKCDTSKFSNDSKIEFQIRPSNARDALAGAACLKVSTIQFDNPIACNGTITTAPTTTPFEYQVSGAACTNSGTPVYTLSGAGCEAPLSGVVNGKFKMSNTPGAICNVSYKCDTKDCGSTVVTNALVCPAISSIVFQANTLPKAEGSFKHLCSGVAEIVSGTTTCLQAIVVADTIKYTNPDNAAKCNVAYKCKDTSGNYSPICPVEVSMGAASCDPAGTLAVDKTAPATVNEMITVNSTNAKCLNGGTPILTLSGTGCSGTTISNSKFQMNSTNSASCTVAYKCSANDTTVCKSVVVTNPAPIVVTPTCNGTMSATPQNPSSLSQSISISGAACTAGGTPLYYLSGTGCPSQGLVTLVNGQISMNATAYTNCNISYKCTADAVSACGSVVINNPAQCPIVMPSNSNTTASAANSIVHGCTNGAKIVAPTSGSLCAGLTAGSDVTGNNVNFTNPVAGASCSVSYVCKAVSPAMDSPVCPISISIAVAPVTGACPSPMPVATNITSGASNSVAHGCTNGAKIVTPTSGTLCSNLVAGTNISNSNITFTNPNAGSSCVVSYVCLGNNGGSDSAVCPINVSIAQTAFPDLIINKVESSSKSSAKVGDTVTYKLTVTNKGTASTNGEIVVNDQLPSTLTFVSVAGSSWDCTSVSSNIICKTNQVLAVNAKATDIVLVSTINAGVTGEISNQAKVAGGGERSQDDNDITGETGNNNDNADNIDIWKIQIVTESKVSCYKCTDIGGDGNTCVSPQQFNGTSCPTGWFVYNSVTDSNASKCYMNYTNQSCPSQVTITPECDPKNDPNCGLPKSAITDNIYLYLIGGLITLSIGFLILNMKNMTVLNTLRVNKYEKDMSRNFDK